MKKISILALIIMMIYSFCIVGCKKLIETTETGGNSNFGADGFFADKGFSGDVTDAVSISEAKSTKSAKVIKFSAADKYVLYKGIAYIGNDEYSATETEILFSPRAIKLKAAADYHYEATYYDINGEKMTTYTGKGVASDKYPKDADLYWVKDTYWNGDDAKYYSEILKECSPDGGRWWAVPDVQYAYVALNGKVYNVESVKGENLYPNRSVKATNNRIVYQNDNETYEFFSGGKVNYIKKTPIKKGDEVIGSEIVGNKKGDLAEGAWTNNGGLITIVFDELYKKSLYGIESLGSKVEYIYWNGIAVGSASLYGSFCESVPAAAKNTK